MDSNNSKLQAAFFMVLLYVCELDREKNCASRIITGVTRSTDRNIPEFRAHWEDEDNPWRESFTFHGVMLDFNDFVQGLGVELSDQQLRSLGALFSAAVAEEDELENAIATCFWSTFTRAACGNPFGPILILTRGVKHAPDAPLLGGLSAALCVSLRSRC